MIRHRRVLLAVTLALLGAAVAGATARASTDAKAGRLVAFRSCERCLGFARFLLDLPALNKAALIGIEFSREGAVAFTFVRFGAVLRRLLGLWLP